MRLPRFLTAGSHGLRAVNLLGLLMLLVVAVGGYAFKTIAEARDASAAQVEAGIVREQKRIRMLRAEIARLGDPRRIADLSHAYLHMAAPDPDHEVTPEALPRIAAQAASPAAPALPGARP